MLSSQWEWNLIILLSCFVKSGNLKFSEYIDFACSKTLSGNNWENKRREN